MHILVSGVRHRTAPIDVRERFALPEQQVAQALTMLRAGLGIAECAILTTCNRTEIYAVVSDVEAGLHAIRQFYRQFKGLDIAEYRQYTFNLLHEDAIAHLFRVASGLDSLIIGEGQIMAQVKDALALAKETESSGILIEKLFKSALVVGKRVRTETGIADKDVSVSLAAYHYVRQLDENLLNRRVALIGGGKMAEIMMSLFKQGMTPEQQQNIILINRSVDRLNELCIRYGFRGCSWDQLGEAIAEADVLFVATGAPHLVLGRADFEGHGDKLVVDIAVPRNVDPRVSELPGIRLFNTDDLAGANGFTHEMRDQLKQKAQTILEEECVIFHQWRMSLSAVPTIVRLRQKVERIRQVEVAASAASCTDTAALETIAQFSRTLVHKILHEPTVRLKSAANAEAIGQQVSVLSHLFGIDAEQLSPLPLDMKNEQGASA
jgi:glutamyl-tRNA reductase